MDPESETQDLSLVIQDLAVSSITRTLNDEISGSFNTEWNVEGITAPSDHCRVDIAAINHVAQVMWEGTDVEKDNIVRGLTREALERLKDGQELVSDIVNKYFQCIQRRADKSAGSTMPSIHVMSDTFFPLLRMFGYDAVRDATDGVDIFSKDMIMFPINNDNHWYLAVADMRTNSLSCYDSLRGADDEYVEDRKNVLTSIHSYLMKERQEKSKSMELNEPWDFIVVERDKVPQQGIDCPDCGVFVCKIADYIATDRNPDFTEKHVTFFRRLMMAELAGQYLYRQLPD